MLGLFKRRRRRRLAAQPPPAGWHSSLAQTMPLYRRLSRADQTELQRHMLVFLAEKSLEGCGGLKVTEPIAVTIAAHACLLLLHRETDYYPALSSVLVYPHAYVAPVVDQPDDWLVTEGLEDREGEASPHGAVVISWADARADALAEDDGRNLLLHEFAHQLDLEDGEADGAPPLSHPDQYVAWARVLGREYARLRADADAGRPTVLDPYGAEDPAEFFAVATECFFERPGDLRASAPELYEQLQQYYRQDPAQRVGAPPPAHDP